jgi:hypothetical protein
MASYSKLLKRNYVKTKRGFLFDNGVLLTFEEAKKKPDEIERIFNERSASDEKFDYHYASSTGVVRKRRSDYTGRRGEPVAQVPAELVEEAEEKLEEQSVSTPSSIQAVRVVFLLLGMGTVTLSALYTYRFLLTTNGAFVSIVLSVSMIVFSVMAATIFVLFLQQGRWPLSVMFGFLWVIVVTYSMFSTVSVNYSGYSAYRSAAIGSDSELKSAYTQYQSSKNNEERAYATVAEAQKVLDKLLSASSTPNWMISQAQADVARAVKVAQSYSNKVQEIIAKYPDVASYEERSKTATKDIYSDLELVTGFPAEKLFFFVNMLPAVFIDIIAPVSVASATFLGGLYGKKQKRAHTGDSGGSRDRAKDSFVGHIRRLGKKAMVSIQSRIGQGKS